MAPMATRTHWPNGGPKDGFLFVLPDALAQARSLGEQAGYFYSEERPCWPLIASLHHVQLQGKSPVGKSERDPCRMPLYNKPDETMGRPQP